MQFGNQSCNCSYITLYSHIRNLRRHSSEQFRCEYSGVLSKGQVSPWRLSFQLVLPLTCNHVKHIEWYCKLHETQWHRGHFHRSRVQYVALIVVPLSRKSYVSSCIAHYFEQIRSRTFVILCSCDADAEFTGSRHVVIIKQRRKFADFKALAMQHKANKAALFSMV